MYELLTVAPILVLILVGLAAWIAISFLFLPGEASIASAGILSYLSTWTSELFGSHHFRRGLSIGTALGALGGLAMAYIAWDHNPQAEIHSPDDITWGLLVAIWAGWTLIGAVLISPLVTAVSALIGRAKRHAV